jgi:D-serine ammonia-lyase
LRDKLALHGAVVRILIDHPDQVRYLEQFESQRLNPQLWSTFVKVDAGGRYAPTTHSCFRRSQRCFRRRAGLAPTSPYFESLLTSIFTSTAISVYGFYTHAGQSYASTSLPEASTFLSAEVDAVNTAAGLALALLEGTPGVAPRNSPFILAVGSTPTAHAATAETREKLAALLNGTLELHAGM